MRVKAGNAHQVAAEQPSVPGIVAEFDSVGEAQRALEGLRALGWESGQISLALRDLEPSAIPVSTNSSDDETSAGSGAATGAALLGLVGGLLGWMVGNGALELPGIGKVVGVGLLASAVVGALLGAITGGIAGALMGIGVPATRAPKSEAASGENSVLMSLHLTGMNGAEAEAVLRANGARSVNIYSYPESESRAMPQSGPLINALVDEKEVDTMNDEQTGRDPDSVTGTRDAIDPETGALGTAGTPMTTGYGVSGSTVGTGSRRGQGDYEGGDYAGATPDTSSYDRGGRSSSDAQDPLVGEPSEPSVVDKYADTRQGMAPAERDRAAHDIYEAGPSYGPANETYTEQIQGRPQAKSEDADMAPDENRTMYYESASPDAPPTYANTPTVETEASGGTNIPGSEDYRGRGDNTDEP